MSTARTVPPGGTSTPPCFALIATDLDGTLLRSDHTVGPRTRAALALATGRGARHVIVTGRSVTWTRPVLDALGYTGLAVCGQGGQVYDADTQRQLTSVILDRAIAVEAVAKIEAEVGPLSLAADLDGLDGQVLTGPGYRHDPVGNLPVVPVGDPADLWAAPVRKFYVQHRTLDEDRLAEAALRVAGHLVGVTKAGPGEVELLPSGLNKATGLAFVARRLGLTDADTVAFGDMPNDVPMLAWAGYGIAMAGAHPELLAVADEVAPSNDADGVGIVLQRLYGKAVVGRDLVR